MSLQEILDSLLTSSRTGPLITATRHFEAKPAILAPFPSSLDPRLTVGRSVEEPLNAHGVDTLANTRYGVATARRAWLTAEQVANTRPWPELDKLRKNATSTPVREKSGRRSSAGISIDDLLAGSLNHRREISRVFDLQMPQGELARGHQITVGLRLEDTHKKPIGEKKTFSVELNSKPDIEKLLLSLKFNISGK